MKETKGTPGRAPTPAATFASWLAHQLTRRGYDVSGPRSGGRTRAAADSGISPATIGRWLREEPVADIDVYRRLSEWLEHPFGDILVRAGLLQPEDLTAPPPDDGTQITPEQAADKLGLKGHSRELFLLNVDALRRTPPAD